MILIAPFGVTSGYVTVAVAYLLTRPAFRSGDRGPRGAELCSAHVEFLWAPIADTTLTRKLVHDRRHS